MLKPAEKAYCQALLALKRKDYAAARNLFDKAAPAFADDKEFNLYRETTRLLLVVKERLAKLDNEDKIEIEETFSNGQTTELR